MKQIWKFFIIIQSYWSNNFLLSGVFISYTVDHNFYFSFFFCCSLDSISGGMELWSTHTFFNKFFLFVCVLSSSVFESHFTVNEFLDSFLIAQKYKQEWTEMKKLKPINFYQRIWCFFIANKNNKTNPQPLLEPFFSLKNIFHFFFVVWCVFYWTKSYKLCLLTVIFVRLSSNNIY